MTRRPTSRPQPVDAQRDRDIDQALAAYVERPRGRAWLKAAASLDLSARPGPQPEPPIAAPLEPWRRVHRYAYQAAGEEE
jgi:hypothetical protein